MRPLQLVIVVILFAQLCLCDEEDDPSTSYVTHHCNNKLRQLDSIEKFNQFVRHFKIMTKVKPKPKKSVLFKHHSRLIKCYELEDAILELDELLKTRDEGVCRMNFIEKLAGYHARHIAREGAKIELSQLGLTKKTYISYFFSLFMHQVALTCKSKLVSRIISAQNSYQCYTILAQFLPESFLDKSEDQELDDVTRFLREFKRVEFFSPIKKSSDRAELEPYFDVKVPEHVMENIESLKVDCRLRQPYYLALLSPISTLSQLGYAVDEPTCDSDDLEDSHVRIMKCWLATAQLCQGILRTHLTLETTVDGESFDKEKLVSVKWGTLPNDVVTSEQLPAEVQFLDTIDEISPEIKGLVEGKFLQMKQLKQKAINLAKSFIIRHVDIDSIEKEAAKKFMDALISSDLNDDKTIVSGFGGQEFNAKKYNPVSIITDDADFLITSTSSFWGSKLSLVMSSIIAVVMSAVFVWFSLYAAITTLKQHQFTDYEDRWKSQWRQLRDEKMKKFAERYNKEDTGIGGYQPR